MADETNNAAIGSRIDLTHFDLATRDARRVVPVWMRIPSVTLTHTEFLHEVEPIEGTTSYRTPTGFCITQTELEIMIHASDTRIESGDSITEFVTGSLHDLFGFSERVRTRDFLNDVFLKEHGLGLCHPIDAYYLRMRSSRESWKKSLCLGMSPVEGDEGVSMILVLRHSKLFGPEISSDVVSPDYLWLAHSEWIFRKLSSEEMGEGATSDPVNSNDTGIGVLV